MAQPKITSWARAAPSGPSSAAATAAERLEAIGRKRAEIAARLELPWPAPKCKAAVGRPTAIVAWQRHLYQALSDSDWPFLEQLESAEPPTWFRRGMSMVQVKARLAQAEKTAMGILDAGASGSAMESAEGEAEVVEGG